MNIDKMNAEQLREAIRNDRFFKEAHRLRQLHNKARAEAVREAAEFARAGMADKGGARGLSYIYDYADMVERGSA